VRADEVGTALYVRSDSDDTTVVAPRLRYKADVAEATSVSAVYAVDVWTSASIDIVTSASSRPVTEQRDEIDLSLDHEFTDVIVTTAYRYSVEPDYVSHGLSGGFSYDFAQNNATLAVGLNVSSDEVGRAGDPEFSRDVSTSGGRLSFTQVLDVDTVATAVYELSRTTGFLSSAYRFVAIGLEWGCATPAPLCVPEVNPGERLRHALALSGRRSLGESVSVGAGYRLYLDDWGVLSHTVQADLGYLAGEHTLLAARYRFYTQGAADHYRPFYLQPEPYVTTDKELSSLSSHRLALELEQGFEFVGDRQLITTFSIAPLLYTYDDFPPLEKITGIEFNAALTLVL
jgi:hypothetical protein